MRWKKIGLGAALAGALALGLSFGAVGQGAVANAQTTTQAEETTSASSLASRFLDQLAAALGIERAALDSAMASAASSTTAAAVADGSLSQAQADALNARAQAGEYGQFFGGRGGHRGGVRVEGVREAMVAAAAQTLGLTEDELTTALRDGQTVAELATAAGTTEEAVNNAALAAAKSVLDQAVAAGTITQAQADAHYAQLEERGLRLGGRGPGGRGPRPSDEAPTTAPTAAPEA